MVVDIPKDIVINEGTYKNHAGAVHRSYQPTVKGDPTHIQPAIELLASAKRPIIYAGGGVINSGPAASQLLINFAQMSGYPVTLTVMGLGAYPASDPQFLGMLGMHGTYEANMACPR